MNLRVTRQNASSYTLDIFTSPDIAELVLARKLFRECPQPVLAAGEQHHVPALAGECAGDRLADSTRRAGDDRYAIVCYRQTLTWRVAANVRPPASAATARNSCLPDEATRVVQEPRKRSDAPFRSMSVCFPSTKKRTDRTGLVELATTSRSAVFPTH